MSSRDMISRRMTMLCVALLLLSVAGVALAQEGLVGKWRALDEKNVIHGFRFIPEIKFSQDGTLYADGTYGYRIIDDGKFLWLMANGAERVYKYQINGDQLMIYSRLAPESRARFKRVR